MSADLLESNMDAKKTRSDRKIGDAEAMISGILSLT
jgi:hypothetical protein